MNKHPLTTWRERHSITQADLAVRVGVSRWTINSIENRNRKPSRDLISALLHTSGNALSFEDFMAAPEREGAAA